jgi:PAS domain S-box-containing protein
MKIIVVDDNEQGRYLIETLLEGIGYEVVTAANGREALDILHSEKINLIVSDVLMPVMDGFELCRKCKADMSLKNIPFVFCTASYPDKKDEEFGLELGAAEYILKPFEPSDFIKTIKDVGERAKEGKISKIKSSLADNELFKLYNERLITKLEQKVSELYAENARCTLIENELRMSENNFRNFLDNSSLGIRIRNEDMSISYSNQAFLDIFGYKNTEEYRQHSPQEYYTPESLAAFVERHDKIARGESVPNKIEVDIKRKDGSIRHAQIFGHTVIWDGKPQAQTFYNDVTELKQAQESMKASEQNFRNSLDSSSIGIRIVDIDGHTLYLNQMFLNIFGYENIEEVRSHPPHEHYTPEAYADYVRRGEKISRGETVSDQFDIDIIRKDGSIRNLQFFRKEVLWDGKKQFQILYNDITERKQAEEAMRLSEEKYRMIVENTRDIIFTLDDKGEYVYVSPSITTTLGYNPSELTGKNFISLVHPDDVSVIQEEIQRSNRFGYQTTEDREYRIHSASGEWRWVVSKGTRVVDSNRKFLHFIGIIRDITERKLAEAERRQLEDKAQAASRLAIVGEMAAGVAHEINNPLTGVLGFSQIILEKENLPADIKEDIKLIADGSRRVSEIVKRLLTFARQSKPVRTLTNVNELIVNTLKLREYVLKTANIEVITRYDPELPLTIVDPGQLQQVFLNLIVNAEQAMKGAHGRGTLTITTGKIGNIIRVSFQDDGPGITKENMGHLFQPFFTTKAPGEGTGLGLSLSRSIISEHGGRMKVESEFSHGANFIIELPIIESLPSEADVQPSIVATKPANIKKGNILVVDDEPGVRILLDRVLTQMGHKVDTVSDAKTALDKLNAGVTYDVILTDVRMPGMSGVELRSYIIEKMPVMNNRIIFITGDVMGADIKNFLTQNKLTFLSKPFDIELIKKHVNDIMTARQ